MKRDEILCNCDRHSVEPVALSKYVPGYEQMWKWMVEFLSKFQGRGIKIDRVNSILVDKSIIFFNILREIAPWVTSSWAIVFFALSLRLLPLVYILWLGPPSNLWTEGLIVVVIVFRTHCWVERYLPARCWPETKIVVLNYWHLVIPFILLQVLRIFVTLICKII